MFSFGGDPDLDIFFEKLRERKGARLGLGALLRFDAPGDLWVNIIKIQQFTSD